MPNDATSQRKNFWKLGEPMVWLSAAALSMTLLSALVLLVVIMVNGLGVFWPAEIQDVQLADNSRVYGRQIKSEETADKSGLRRQYKIANRDLYSLDFRWIDEKQIIATSLPENLLVLERVEHGDFYGTLKTIKDAKGRELTADIVTLQQQLRVAEHDLQGLAELEERLKTSSYQAEQLRLKLLKLEYNNVPVDDSRAQKFIRQKAVLDKDFGQLVKLQTKRMTAARQASAVLSDASGTEKEIALVDIVRAYTPNQMTTGAKVLFYGQKLWELLSGEPRESNTEGGLFPAIFGTVMLIFVMSLFSFPLGVIAAVYLREYARDGVVVRVVRIAVNNLAGIPSIVYGIFGLGFFIYGIGHSLDTLFFPERLPTPTFGTGGLLWASLTLALMTVPVVIVSTEEALGAIPRDMREGSYALGATKFQTLYRILLPMASPGIMTGLILAMARAAGEVAPLMITGVVKLAPALPIDGNFPFFHLDRKFMHLGFHIYDIGFQSPNV
ncbi:MAG: phosphate ABC transporter permease PstA, partial [Geopsychrobacter sp.]|nr:phosphate ABC transporter permease PstA [Geopsychrobacter sp.]